MTKLPADIQKKLDEISECETRAQQLRHDIKDWYDEVRAAVASLGLDDMAPAPTPTEVDATPKRRSGREPKGSKPQIELVADVVNSDPTREWSVKEVHDHLIEQGEEINKPTVGSTLAKARNEGMIVQDQTRGPYRAKTAVGGGKVEAASATVHTVGAQKLTG